METKKKPSKSNTPTSKLANGQSQHSSCLPQEASMLMQLPQEIRDMIYSELFLSIQISSSGHMDLGTTPNALALLRTCRRVHSEVGNTWVGKVLFKFGSSRGMLDKLANIPAETLSMIRYMFVAGDGLRVPFEEEEVIFYRLYEALGLLPGLKLDRLIVWACPPFCVAYETITKLINSGSGWKELHFTSPWSHFLSYKYIDEEPFDHEDYRRKPQPSDWQKQLDDRDGSLSSPSVTIYRAKTADADADILDPDQRAPFEQRLKPGQTVEEFSKEFHDSLRTDDELLTKALVVVKRGHGVDYEQRYDPENVIRDDVGKSTWQEIKTYLETRHPEFDHNLEENEYYGVVG
ncbi:hypothetical protein IWZ00DRAFT_566057 [Phyllosticta capitalensis]